ncbi:MAG: beta-N-acetylhexosaminidase [Pseudomonadota bacterium]
MGISACILSVSGQYLTQNEQRFLKDANPWGVILMGRSCGDKPQVKALIDDIQDATGRRTLIFIDQEGGRVARLRPPVWSAFPAAGVYGRLYQSDPDRAVKACRLGYKLLGAELAEIGIFANCAPVADLRQTSTHDSIGDRAFSKKPDEVVDLARAALNGLKEAGVAGCLKHMPGQGRAEIDSHYDLPRITADIQSLEQDFSIFRAFSDDALMGMTGHVRYNALDPKNATTVSQKVISETIRGRIGFDGLLMTDDLGMEALGGGLAERGKRALAAGCDVLLHCSGFVKDERDILNEMIEVADCAGTLRDDALRRANAVDASLSDAQPFDRAEAWDDYQTYLDSVSGARFNA